MAQDQSRLLGGRYRLVAAVGRGGMGTVWRAYDEVLDREVAVKEVLLPPGLSAADTDVLYQRTFREARASARLNHPGVVTVHDVISEQDRPWIVMELVRARSLQDVIDDDGPLTPRTAADIGRQVLAALSHAHKAGILHRDVKPSNVLITEDGRAVLTDFGIAQVEGDSTLTQTGLVMGSPAYIPPERVQGERAVPASDLWALGATLYASVEGKAPYERSDAMAALAAALTEEVPEPRNAGPLRGVLLGLLARDPADRMTVETAMPLLAEVANRAPLPPRADPTMMDRDATRPEAAMETVLDASAIEAALRDSATFTETPQPPAIFRQESGTRRMDDQRTEAQQDWQPAPHDPWQQTGGPARPPAYAPRAHEQQQYQQPYQQQSYQPQMYEQQTYEQQTYEQQYRPQQYQPQGRTHQPTRGRTVVIVLLTAVVVAALLVGGALLLKSRSSATDLPHVSTSGTPATTLTPTRSVTLPAGYERRTADGFSVGVPAGWRSDSKERGAFYTAPNGSTLLQVEQTEWQVDAPSDQADSANQSLPASGAFKGYTHVSTTNVRYQGQPATDLEFTCLDSTGRTIHAVDRFVRFDGKPFAIYFRSLESDWITSQTTLKAMLDSFVAG